MLFFGIRNKDEKIKNISWSVPVPPDLLSQLREFSPVAISRMSGIYLDDVFDILRGERRRTAPELIEKLNNTLVKLRKHDEELEREAAKMAYMIRGMDMIELQEQKKRENVKLLPEPEKS
ncbi:MAG: hypothetical protein CVV33_01520 [Methanomicrobiales archaeon HGW-Methanomicrobiales-4]|nr:MAG: hypothetical protein CVV33_01520 [Methanomicrobiales archaeon HGW-Methanomicrobiales-4]